MRLRCKDLWPQVVAAGLLMLMPNLTVDRDPVASPDPDPLRRLRRILRQRGRGRLCAVRAGSIRCGRMRMRFG